MDEINDKLPLLFKCFRDSLIGKNTRGIIHNINSPLQVLSMQIELLRMDYLNLKEEIMNHGAEVLNKDSLDKLSMLMEKSEGRLLQVEEVLQRINALIAVIAARVSETDETGGAPVMLNQLLEEQVEFWKSDLFFKHKVSLSFKLSELSPVIVIREDILRDVIDGILFGCLEQIREQAVPQIEIECCPGNGKTGEHIVLFSHNGSPFPVADIKKLIRRFLEKGGDDFTIFDKTSQGYFSLLIAYVSGKTIGCSIVIEEQKITLNL